MSETAYWRFWDFQVLLPDDEHFPEEPGLYVFAGLNSAKEWVPLYIGETGSLAERLATHEKWTEAEQLGATHIHVRVEESATVRLSIETELIRDYQPRVNVQHKG